MVCALVISAWPIPKKPSFRVAFGPSELAQNASQKVCHLLPTSAILMKFVPEILFRARRPAVPPLEQRWLVTHTVPRRAKINRFSGRGNRRSTTVCRRCRGRRAIGIGSILDVAVGPVEHLGQNVQDGFAGAITVALVRQHDEPGRPAVPFDRLE